MINATGIQVTFYSLILPSRKNPISSTKINAWSAIPPDEIRNYSTGRYCIL